MARQVGQRIRHLRRARGLSQEAFAAQCGLHRTYIGALERGEKTMTIETANTVARTLGLTLAELFAHLEPSAGEHKTKRTAPGRNGTWMRHRPAHA